MSKKQIFHGIKWPNLVNQVDDETCVQACLAIVLGIPIKEVIKGIGKKPLRDDDITLYLAAYGIVCEVLNQTGWVYGVYLIKAPSLNIPYRMHELIICVRQDWPEEAPWQILDPQCGRKEKKFYIDSDMATGKLSWCQPMLLRKPNVDIKRIQKIVWTRNS